ncbi:MAG TPA: hypothetical protein VFT74_02785 [Isosphaeraceae bacterium]|nr:hypothetical protein [Isosphaeraceae bacterium]
MAIVQVKEDALVDPTKIPVPGDVQSRLKRGTDAMKEGAPKRRECLAHYRGDQYKYLDSQNKVVSQPTNTSSYGETGGKPPHRVRRVRNVIFDIVETEVAATTQRVPGYEVAPSGTEPRRISAARLSRKVLLYGWEKWNVRRALERVVRYALIADEGFAWPYFDNSIGPYLEDEEGNRVGQGELCIHTYGPNEVFWEPGLKFEESPWHGIQQARDVNSVMQMEGYVGGELNPDARNAELEVELSPQSKLVMVTEYLERPTKKNPEGRWLTMANERVIVNQRPYPCVDGEGKVLDEPVLHRLAYAMDPEQDRDLGLVRHLLDANRDMNHAESKITEWINLALNPQVIITNGFLKDKLTDEPGAVFRAVGSGEVTWRPVPPIPRELFTRKQEAIADMQRIAGHMDTGSVESGRGIQALIEQEGARRANFLAALAEFDAALARHCLYLVQRHYTEPRLLKVRGERGIEPIQDFYGSELLSETDVRVAPDSLEALTREGVEKKIMAFAERGWIPPHAAMAAINNGTAENLVESYERDVARANLIIQKVTEGPEALFQTPPRRPFFGEEPGIDEETGQPKEFVPGWMPRPFDNVKVQKDVFADWMKSTEYDDLDQPSQEAANAYYEALLQIEAKHNAEAAEAQEMTAQSLGMSNAAKPQGPPPLPDQAPLT